MTDLSDDTLRQIRAASFDNMSKVAKAEFLRERGWRQIFRGKTPQWRSPSGVVASSAAVACRLQVLADQADM